MAWHNHETALAMPCKTCGQTQVAEYDGRPLVPGFGMEGVRVFGWKCLQGHWNSLPSSQIDILRDRWDGSVRTAQEVVTLHKMD